MTTTHPLPSSLVDTDWLAAHLDDPDLRILDATVFYRVDPVTNAPVIESGRAAWAAGHIPNSTFIDLISEISDADSPLRFALPSAAQFSTALARHGVGSGTRVVIYDGNNAMWAARVWWLLRAFGFEAVALLDGGWKKWQLEGRPVSTTVITRPEGRFEARLDPAWVASTAEVAAAMRAGQSCIINALGSDNHRQARIPGSVNVPAVDMLDPTTGAYLPLDILKDRFAAHAALDGSRVLTYCGAGIAATSTAFILSLLGARSVAVYDGSLQEWTADGTLPLDSGG